MKLDEAKALIGRQIRYMKKGGRRYGWEGVITEANTVRVTVVYDNGVEQSYQMDALYQESNTSTAARLWRTPYIMVLGGAREARVRRLKLDEKKGVRSCGYCEQRPYVKYTRGDSLFHCCGTPWMDVFNWNAHVQRFLSLNYDSFEQVERNLNGYADLAKEYEGVDYEPAGKINPVPHIDEAGRIFERLGKVMQDPNSTIRALTHAADLAGFSVRIEIQPKVE